MTDIPIRPVGQILTATDFVERGVTFITDRPQVGLIAEPSVRLTREDEIQLHAFITMVNVLSHAKARVRAAPKSKSISENSNV